MRIDGWLIDVGTTGADLLGAGHEAAGGARRGWLEVEGDRITAVGDGPCPGPADLGGPDALLSPGFVDAHVHLPQFGSVGCDGLPLLTWLERVVFPAEAAWVDPVTAETAARAALLRMARAGTLAFAGFLTAHAHGPSATAAANADLRLRGRIGRALMDRGGPPELLGEPAPSTTDARSLEPALEISINPRFAPACSDELLARAGEVATAGDRWIHTHLAETPEECAVVAERFPDDASYVDVYDRFGLLGEQTLLAHAIHLDAARWDRLAERRSTVVHCPSANVFLAAGIFDLRAARSREVPVALGSDVAAGPDPAMPRVARAMIEVAKLRRLTVDPGAIVPTPAEAWSMMTRGNADALGWPDLGRLEVGASASLLVLRAPVERDEHLLGRLLYGWDDRWIVDRLVGGRRLVLPTGPDAD